MVQRGRGVVVNISSSAAARIAPGWSVYAASKAGLDQLTRSVAVDLKDTAVRIYSLYPGLVDTRMLETLCAATPDQLPHDRRQFFVDQKEAGKAWPPEVPARAVVWLCSPRCELASGTVVDLRRQPELHEQIDRALGV
jgi:NAD(P)-dependent dehydrogenase (short-subunit alcohol dehydrogenase family)